MVSDEERLLVEQFLRIAAEYDAVEKKLSAYFLPKAEALSKAGDVDGVRELLRRCPEGVTQVFIADQLRQARLKTGK